MLSPLEHEPDLIAGIGLITARWAALESELAKALGTTMLQSTAGDAVYYSLGTFSQRVDLVLAAIKASLSDERHIAISEALANKIKRIWKTRNYLVHSHYVYAAKNRDGGHWALTGVISQLGEHPGILKKSPLQIVDLDSNPINKSKIMQRGFAYQKRKSNGITELVFVNKGTFHSHADQLHRRSRQISYFAKAIERGRAPIVLSQSALKHISRR